MADSARVGPIARDGSKDGADADLAEAVRARETSGGVFLGLTKTSAPLRKSFPARRCKSASD